MGRFKSFTILLTLVSWGATTDGAPPDDAAPQARPTLPPGVQAGDYVRAVATKIRQGKPDEAGPYLEAAQAFRDQLSPEELAALDQYAQMLAPAPGPAGAPATVVASSPAPGSNRDRAVALVAAARQAQAAGQPEQARAYAREADALAVPFAPEEDNPARVLAELDRANGPIGGRGATNNPRQQAMWLLHSAREQIQVGNYQAAIQFLAQAKAMDVRWGLFDDTPSKVERDLNLAMAQAPNGPAAGPAATPGDRRQARTRLKEARAALERGDAARAKAIALEVQSWGHHYGALEDSPAKVLSACRAVERRDAVRQVGSTVQTNEEIYHILVTESRQLIAQGRYDEAEARARQAQGMPVVPPVTADRAEAVLHDLAMLRARGEAPAAEPPSVAAEREANRLLSQNQVEAARAKFEESERLRAQELGVPADAAPIGLGATPAAADASLVRTDGDGALPPPEVPAGPVGEAAGPHDPIEAGLAPMGEAPAPTGEALGQARALLASGNYGAARQAAQQARDAGAGAEADELLAQIDQTRQQAGLQLYEAALASLRANQVERSRALLNELASGELDEVMAQKVQDLLAKLPAEGAGHAEVGIGTVEDAEVVRAQQMNAEVGTRIAESRRLMETDPQKAIDLLQQTLASVQAAGLNEAVTRTLVKRIEINVELAKKDKVEFDRKMKDKNYREEIERKRLRILEADKAKKERLKEFMDKAMEAQANDDWVEAEKFARLAAEIDPNEIAATALATKARIMRHYERDKQIRADSDESRLNLWQDVEAAAIVSQDVINRGIGMPEDFKELTELRRRTAARLAPNYKTAQALEIEKKLNETITLPNSDRMSLGEALRYIGEYTGLNIVPDHRALSEEGLTLDSPVNLSAVNNIKLKSVLKYMLNPLNLSYTIDPDGVLVITSPQAKRKQMETRVYSVADLVLSPLQRNKGAIASPGAGFVAPPGMAAGGNDPNVLQAQADAMSGNAQAGMALPGAGGGGWGVTNFERDKPEFEPLIQLIKTSIAPGTWSNNHAAVDEMGAYGQGAGFGDAAGEDEGVGSITPFFLNISLIIRQTAEVHDEIVDLLRQLRRLQDLQVSIEVRFINVSDSFFEQIGVDFDFAIQSDAVGRKSSFATVNPAALPGGATGGGTGTTAQTAIAPYLINPVRDHALGRQPLVVGTNAPTESFVTPSFNPGLQIPFLQSTSDEALNLFNAVPNLGGTFGIAFLSDLEVYLFLQAIQGDVRSNLVQAPKVTSFNGAPASVINFTGRNYVAQLTPIIGAGAVAFTPQISTFPDGVQLFVTPVVSADRRYVRMSLSPFFTTFLGFDTFSIPAAVGGGGLGGQSSTITAQVQLPQFSITNVSTTVTVPDGGTVLLGGVKRLREERREFGVPILAKTPLIDRLFRNIGIGRTTDSLMLMVTPRIIILEEEEERLGVPAIQNITF